MEGGAQEKILVIKLGALGDFLQALGPMATIRAHHKNAHITLLTTKPFAEWARTCPYFDAILTDKRPKALALKGWLSLRKTLNAGNFTRVYDLQNNDRTNLYFKLFSKKNRPEWVGTAKGASHRNTSPLRTAGHAFDGHVQTLALAGITNIPPCALDWMQADISGFSLCPPYVLLVIGSAPQHPQKRWPAAHYGALARLLIANGFQPVLLGSTAEQPLARIIQQNCPQALDLTGQTSLAHIASLAKGAACTIGNDTGPMHLIAATTCPSLVLFSGHSNPARHAPKGKHVEILQSESLNDLKVPVVWEAFMKIARL